MDHNQDSRQALGKELGSLFLQANKIAKKRYHKLTDDDFKRYRAYDYWRYVDGDGELGVTSHSQQWVWDNSDKHCPICNELFHDTGGRTIDHKLPRAQYPWLSMDFRNFWVICRSCNREKGEKHWYEYEKYILEYYPERYSDVRFYRPMSILQELAL